ncbi:MAG: hypothetical protein RIC29_07730 [Rhodospirillaceae bacterium]
MMSPTLSQCEVSRRSVMMSAVAAGGALAFVPMRKPTADTSFVQDLKIQQPRVTAFADGSGLAASSLPILELIEAYTVDADLVIVSIADEKRLKHFNRSLDQTTNLLQKHQSYVLVLSESPEVSTPFTWNTLIGAQGVIAPYLDEVDLVSWQTEFGVISATTSGKLTEFARYSSANILPDLIVCHGDLGDTFQVEVDHALTAYKIDLHDLDNKGAKIYALNGEILTQAAPGFQQGVTAKIDVMEARQTRTRSAVPLVLSYVAASLQV